MKYDKIFVSPGHGGLAFNAYLTPGKQSPSVPPGIYEGAYNREVTQRMESLAATSQYPNKVHICDLAPGPVRIPLKARAKLINDYNSNIGPAASLAVHCNAEGNGANWTQANGFTVFYNPRGKFADASEHFANLVYRELSSNDCPIVGRAVKPGRRLYMVRKPQCPAILVELGFMTNFSDTMLLIKYQAELARSLTKACYIMSQTEV